MAKGLVPPGPFRLHMLRAPVDVQGIEKSYLEPSGHNAPGSWSVAGLSAPTILTSTSACG